MTTYNALTDVPGIQVGHWTDLDAATGCTVVLCTDGAVAGVDVRGGAPGTRETDLLDPTCTVEQVHAILLGGGSAFGLTAADGVMRWLEERHIGFNVGVTYVPIVPAAILFDLGIGSPTVRPTAESGYAACEAAAGGAIEQGNVGAGAGATVGKRMGFPWATKGGLGTASAQIEGGIIVAALVAVNAVGDVVDPRTGRIIAGARKPGGGFAFEAPAGGATAIADMPLRNTTIAVVATNAKLSKAGATKVAQMAHDGLARVLRPAHLPMDGDTVFALSLGAQTADLGRVGAVAADVLADALLAAIMAAETLKGIPSARDLQASNTQL
ncbi:MAG: P1 family peptidase [Chloroflexi bacterium]|nr:P1 family peptidase [Chloroflexota bacterium]